MGLIILAFCFIVSLVAGLVVIYALCQVSGQVDDRMDEEGVKKMADDLESTQVVLECWTPKRLTAQDLADIVQGYGVNNDTFSSEEDADYPVKWEIEIKAKRVGGAELWP